MGFFQDIGNAINGVAGDIFGGGTSSPSNGGVPTQQAAGMADPFAGSRGMYGQQLNQLMQGGPQAMQQLQNMPGYQFTLNQGLGAVQAQDAASGSYGSGAMSKDLVNYASGLASQNYNTYFNQLSQLSGAGWNNGGAAGQLLLGGQQQGYNQNQSNVGSLTSAASSGGGLLGGLAQGISSIFGF